MAAVGAWSVAERAYRSQRGREAGRTGAEKIEQVLLSH